MNWPNWKRSLGLHIFSWSWPLYYGLHPWTQFKNWRCCFPRKCRECKVYRGTGGGTIPFRGAVWPVFRYHGTRTWDGTPVYLLVWRNNVTHPLSLCKSPPFLFFTFPISISTFSLHFLPSSLSPPLYFPLLYPRVIVKIIAIINMVIAKMRMIIVTLGFLHARTRVFVCFIAGTRKIISAEHFPEAVSEIRCEWCDLIWMAEYLVTTTVLVLKYHWRLVSSSSSFFDIIHSSFHVIMLIDAVRLFKLLAL